LRLQHFLSRPASDLSRQQLRFLLDLLAYRKLRLEQSLASLLSHDLALR
jgi:hypothetical protein